MSFRTLIILAGLSVLTPTLDSGHAWADQQSAQITSDRDGKWDEGREPLVIQKQGSFFINERNIVSAFPSGTGPQVPGNLSVDGMYVEYQIPEHKKYAFPIIMIHGASHTAKTWDETPDGREGWKTYFLRKGFSVYVVDDVGRGRSGFDPTSVNQAKLQSNPTILPSLFKFTNEVAWTAFRIGATPYTPFPGSQFPVNYYNEYVAQMVPNTEVTVDPTCQTPGPGCTLTPEAVGALLKKIGPAIVMGHSQGGTISMAIANTSSNLVKAVITVEPASGCIIPSGNVPLFKNLAFFSVFGDNTATYPNWVSWISGCKASAASIRSIGGTASVVVLPDIGIKGNSHMLMLEKNNDRIADLIIDWIDKSVKHARLFDEWSNH